MIPVADNIKKTIFADAIPKITSVDFLNPLDAASAVTARAAGPGERTTTKVVIKKSINVSSEITTIPLLFSSNYFKLHYALNADLID